MLLSANFSYSAVSLKITPRQLDHTLLTVVNIYIEQKSSYGAKTWIWAINDPQITFFFNRFHRDCHTPDASTLKFGLERVWLFATGCNDVEDYKKQTSLYVSEESFALCVICQHLLLSLLPQRKAWLWRENELPFSFFPMEMFFLKKFQQVF